MKRLTRLGLGLTTVWVLIFGFIVVLRWRDAGQMELNEWGDFVAGFSAPLALLWLVIGYFQQGEELQLNTDALRAQQEELRRQVEETAFLARNAERQAAAAELLANLNKTEQEKTEQRERVEAQPTFWASGGSVSGPMITTKVKNRGGEVTDVEVLHEGPYQFSFSHGRLWKHEQVADIVFVQPDGVTLEWPIRFTCRYVDSLEQTHERRFEFTELHKLHEIST